MDFFVPWIGVLVVFEWASIAQLVYGRRVHEMSQGFFVTPESEVFHLWYGWFLFTLAAARLCFVLDRHNKAIVLLNTSIHVVEAAMFTVMYKNFVYPVVMSSTLSPFTLPAPAVEASVVYSVIVLVAVTFCARSVTVLTASKKKQE